MVNAIKRSKYIPNEWNTVWITTLKKRKGTSKKLDNYRGIFIVPILSIIFEKLFKKYVIKYTAGQYLQILKWCYERERGC